MTPFAIQALIVGAGVTMGLWFLWWRTGQMAGLRRLAMALLAGGGMAVATQVISRTIAAI